MAPLSLLGLAGSLRRGSHNRALLHALRELVPTGVTLTVFDGLNEVPLYNGDLEEGGFPESVVALRQAVAAADGLLIATPEYNAGVPGVLKNALDWISRPPAPKPLHGKPVGIAGATPGRGNTAAAQNQLRETLVAMGAACMASPTLRLSQVQHLLDPEGRIVDAATRETALAYGVALSRWVERLRAS